MDGEKADRKCKLQEAGVRRRLCSTRECSFESFSRSPHFRLRYQEGSSFDSNLRKMENWYRNGSRYRLFLRITATKWFEM